MPRVEYRTIDRFPHYRFGNDGSVWSKRRGHWRRMRRNADKKSGYLRITLNVSGKRSNHRVHRLILEAFVGPGSGMEGCHFPDPNKRNCRCDNLRWDTPEENRRDIARLDRYVKGESHPSSKMDEPRVRLIREKIGDGQSLRSVAREFRLHPRTVGKIWNRKTWSHVQ